MKIHDDDTDKTSRQGAGDKENEATPDTNRSVSRENMSDNDPPVIIDGGKSAS
jgi:hypothetical protein